MAKFFLVGGAVRDEILGVPCKDIDYAVEAPSFDAMRQAIIARGGAIFQEVPEFLTIKAKVPELGATDYVLCRKEGAYRDGRHPESVEVGTIYDDLARRDFTVNAIAKDVDTGEYIDPHSGRSDLNFNLLRCVGDAAKRFDEDRLRILRAIRFHITKGFHLHGDIVDYLSQCGSDCLKGVSVERIREELFKCFEKDTLYTLFVLKQTSMLAMACFGDGKLILKPTIRP